MSGLLEKEVEILTINPNCKIGILNLSEFSAINRITEKRRIEKEGTNFLIKTLLPGKQDELGYSPHGKPYLKNHSENISISHSHEKLCLIVDKLNSTGVDIELIRDKVNHVKHKFLCEVELEELIDAETEKLMVYWSAKETIYKIIGRKGIDFSHDIIIHPFHYNASGGLISGSVSLPGLTTSYTIAFEKRDEYILTYPIY